jgi:hypothetical protein
MTRRGREAETSLCRNSISPARWNKPHSSRAAAACESPARQSVCEDVLLWSDQWEENSAKSSTDEPVLSEVEGGAPI